VACEQGNKLFEAGDFEKAIQKYSKSIKLWPSLNAFYNRAICFYYLGDTCSFCSDLEKAASYNDAEAAKLFYRSCFKKTMISIVPDSVLTSLPSCIYTIKTSSRCRPDSSYSYFNKADRLIGYLLLDGSRQRLLMLPEDQPQFPGGMDALSNFISMNMQYPEAARSVRISGTVIAGFDIGDDGNISNIQILKGIGAGCDDEVLRLISIMPRWIPASINGVLTKSASELTIKFQLH